MQRTTLLVQHPSANSAKLGKLILLAPTLSAAPLVSRPFLEKKKSGEQEKWRTRKVEYPLVRTVAASSSHQTLDLSKERSNSQLTKIRKQHNKHPKDTTMILI